MPGCCRSFQIRIAQGRSGLHRERGAWKFRQDRIANEFDDSTFVAPNDPSGECLKDFNQLKRAKFVFCSTCAIPGHVRKPDGSEAMGKGCSLHANAPRSSMYRDASHVEPHSTASISLRFFLSDEFPFAHWATIFSFVSPRFSS